MIKKSGESPADIPQVLVNANIRMLRWVLVA